ncbi:MAG: aconitate hydratase AcnA [Burkholderiales bacterium]|nr:aconitate hydratase AcnA [Burkholderiales bacterium]
MTTALPPSLESFSPRAGVSGKFHRLANLEQAGLGRISRLPISIRVVLESLLRNCDGKRVTEAHVRSLAAWQPNAERTTEVPFIVARILLQDLAGLPALNDFASLRSAARSLGKDPAKVEPLVPVDLVVDHSVQVDHHNSAQALRLNMEIEFKRNAERYSFLKWGMQAFSGIKFVPPGIGIVHQVNLEYLSRGVWEKNGVYYFDSTVGTDSHTTMVNGIGVVAWGVGGIEAEAGMLGQPIYFLTPDVVGVHFKGRLREGVTATDLVLTVVELLRKHKVVAKFVEFFGEGAASLSVPDRATVGNMAPEYGATIGFFPVDEVTVGYLRSTGRTSDEIAAFEAYWQAQGMFGMPRAEEIDYTRVIELDLDAVRPSVAGPKRPQDRIALPELKARFGELLTAATNAGGYGKSSAQAGLRVPAGGTDAGHGDILIAAITSCTNTSNPAVLLGAGLLAKKAVEKGLKPNPRVKASLAPGSRVVTEYLRAAGLLPYLEQLGFHVVGYGCTTCMGNTGPLDAALEEAVVANDLIGVAVLSGNRNFEARVHQSLKANFLMSPPLVVAFALAGSVLLDVERDPIGTGSGGTPVYLRDLWPSNDEIAAVMPYATDGETFRRLYGDFSASAELWSRVPAAPGAVFQWDARSTYIKEPPFFEGFTPQAAAAKEFRALRALGIYGDSVTTDHISPVAAIKQESPAGAYLTERGVAPVDFSNFGMRRCNHEIMARGTFANVRIRNLMAGGKEGGYTTHQPSGELLTVYDAAMRYQREGVALVVFGGEEYGTGSSRDWAAKGPLLLGVKVVIARGFERIHRSNLVGMGILPLQFQGDDSVQSLGITGTEQFDVVGLTEVTPGQQVTLLIRPAAGAAREVSLVSRIDTPIEVDYYRNGGILPYMLRELVAA